MLEMLSLAFVLVWAAIAVGVLRRRGLLRLDVVLGRPRLGPEHNPWMLLMILLVALSTSLVAGQIAVTTWDVPENWRLYLHGTVVSLVGIAIAVGGMQLLGEDGLKRIGLRWGELRRSIGGGFLALLAILPAVYVLGWVATAIAQSMGQPPEPHNLLTALLQTADWRESLMIAGMAVILAPLLEELVFRGLLQTFLTRLLTGPAEQELPTAARVLGRWQSILITSLLFAAIHGELAFMPPLFALSVGLGIAYERTGSLWTSMVMHALFNSSQIVVIVLLMGDVA